jgi:hypothetical protein
VIAPVYKSINESSYENMSEEQRVATLQPTFRRLERKALIKPTRVLGSEQEPQARPHFIDTMSTSGTDPTGRPMGPGEQESAGSPSGPGQEKTETRKTSNFKNKNKN